MEPFGSLWVAKVFLVFTGAGTGVPAVVLDLDVEP
jgi:hypothetical protein